MPEQNLASLFEAGFNSYVQEKQLEKKASLDKRAVIDLLGDSISEKFTEKFAEGLANISARTLFEMGGKALDSYKSNKLPAKNQAFITKLMSIDPVLKSRPPERVASHYLTMVKVAPSISLDENVVSSFLKESTAFDSMSTVTIKSLLDLEKTIAETDEKKKSAYGKLISM